MRHQRWSRGLGRRRGRSTRENAAMCSGLYWSTRTHPMVPARASRRRKTFLAMGGLSTRTSTWTWSRRIRAPAPLAADAGATAALSDLLNRIATCGTSTATPSGSAPREGGRATRVRTMHHATLLGRLSSASAEGWPAGMPTPAGGWTASLAGYGPGPPPPARRAWRRGGRWRRWRLRPSTPAHRARGGERSRRAISVAFDLDWAATMDLEDQTIATGRIGPMDHARPVDATSFARCSVAGRARGPLGTLVPPPVVVAPLLMMPIP
jgi:hypothetical protein